jgi:prevent-host-death family protein
MNVTEDVVSITDFKACAAGWLARIRKTGTPVIITQNGGTAGVLVPPAEFDRLIERDRRLGEMERAESGQTLAVKLDSEPNLST